MKSVLDVRRMRTVPHATRGNRCFTWNTAISTCFNPNVAGVVKSAGVAEWSSRGREGAILSFTRALRANPVAKAGSLSPLKLIEY
jgi:hypothetical protein